MFETNEAGEIVLVEEVKPAKKTRKQKKEKEQLFVPPFFSEDYFKFLMTNNGGGEGQIPTTQHSLLRWKNEEYLPLYSIGMKVPNQVPYYEYITINNNLTANNPGVLDNVNVRLIRNIKNHMPVHGHKFFKNLWLNKHYKFLTFFNDGYISPSIELDFKKRMKELLEIQDKQFLDKQPDVTIQVPNGSYGQGTPRLMSKFKHQNEWRWTMVKQQGVPWDQHPVYLSNLGFIGKQSDYAGREGGVLGMRPIKPLVCIVFKKEYFELIKHYIIANQPIPGELLEIWVDKSLDDVNSTQHNIRASYIRQIKNPYKKFGVETIVKDSLVDELYHRPELRKFRTFIEQQDWVDNILQEFTVEEKKMLRIS